MSGSPTGPPWTSHETPQLPWDFGGSLVGISMNGSWVFRGSLMGLRLYGASKLPQDSHGASVMEAGSPTELPWESRIPGVEAPWSRRACL